ncbi:MAG TPA: hypothetical protein VNW89_17875 [Stellaceae bacterium]|nr:hypothetical protein [Stellaceae bacterium]
MTSAGSSSSSGTFATPDAGSGYFATAEHHQHLAKGVIDALYRGGVVLVSGDPPACLPMLVEALRTAAAPRAVIEISCGPGLDFSELYAGAVLPSPIYVFDDADRLSDVQIEALLDATQAVPVRAPTPRAGVLLANSSFPSARGKPVQDLLEERLAARLRLGQLDRDETEAFIRYQLPPDGGSNLLTAQRVALIAITSGGDPAVVNRLAYRMFAEPGASLARDEAAAPRARWRQTAGIFVCLAIFGLIVGAVGSRDLGGLVGNVLPQKDNIVPAAGVPAQEAPPVASSTTGATKAAVEPAAAGSERPPAAPPSFPAAVPLGPRLSADEIAALVARGDGFLAAGDIASARLFFQRAADAGDSGAAMRMAMTFDAAFLDRAGVHGLRSDPEQAAFWYRRARDLGAVKTQPAVTPANEPPAPSR